MISLSSNEVERRFTLLGLPGGFGADEKLALETMHLVDLGPRIFAFPTPFANEGLNILNLRRICGTDPARQPSFFDHPWYLDEAFAAENCVGGWHFIHMDVLPDSVSQPLNYADSLRGRGFTLPSAVEVTLMLFLHYIGGGEQLLQKKHTWCRDRASLDRFVTVGAFGRNGLFVSGHPAAFASRGLGICAKLTNAPADALSG